jgi:drug/metabolite transporter (DMT)-like permease
MRSLKVHASLVLVAFIYGANFSIAKSVMPDYLHPFGFIGLRVAGACLLFWLFHRLAIRDKEIDKRDYLRLAACGLFGVAINQLMFFKGLNYTTPINAAIIMTVGPVLVLVFSALLKLEKIRPLNALGILLGLSGAVLLLLEKEVSLSNQGFVGDSLVLLNVSSYALYLVLVKPLMHRYKAATVIKWVFAFGFLMVLPFSWTELQQTDWSSFPRDIWLAVGFVVVFTTFIAYLLNAWALQYVTSSVVGIYIYLQPIFASLVALAFGQDRLTGEKIAYSLIIFTGVFLVSRKPKNHSSIIKKHIQK